MVRLEHVGAPSEHYRHESTTSDDRAASGGDHEARRGRRHDRARGVHPPDPLRGRSRDHPQRPARPDARAPDAGHRLRPDDRHGLRAPPRLFVGWKPGVGSLHRFRDAVERGWPSAARARRAQPCRAWPTAMRPAPPASRSRVLRGYVGQRSRRAHTSIKEVTCPFTGEVLSAVSALELDVAVIHAQQADRAGNVQLWGIIGVQKEAVLCAAAGSRHGRGDRRRARAAPRRGRAARTGRSTTSSVVQNGAHPSYTHGYTSGTTTSTSRGTRSAATATFSARGWRTMSSRAEPAARRSRHLDGGGDDDDRRRARAPGRATCLVGIGLPSTAANLARRVHAPGLVLVYESGTIGAKPEYLPLSIGDGILAETADTVVGLSRSSTTGSSPAASTSASSAPRRSTVSPTSTRR